MAEKKQFSWSRVMVKKKGTRNGDNGETYTRKLNWIKLLWLPILLAVGSGGSFFGYSLTQGQSTEYNLSIKNEHKIDMLEQSLNLRLLPMEKRLEKIERHLEKIVDKLDAK